jgi:hypothetical protein
MYVPDHERTRAGALRGAEGCSRSKTMMDATGRWLAPMMAAADEHGIDV